MLLISRDSEHVQGWPDDTFAEQVDVKPGGLERCTRALTAEARWSLDDVTWG
jgi:hypothetical protein